MIGKIIFTTLLYISGIAITYGNPPDNPISPTDMKGMIGRGFDVSWAEFTKNMAGYGVDEVLAIKARGFKNVRIRTGLAADAQLLSHLDRIINDCLNNSLIPILAYNAKNFEDNPSQANLKADSLWWAKVANHLKDKSHRLIFDINIEWSENAGKDADLVNNFYKVVTPGIRATNPTRILVYSPIKLSSPEYLPLMKIPASAGQYVMAEWHLYAAGPSDDPTHPRYWSTGTYAEKKVISDEINIGAAWEAQTGIKTWVGAWMAGNYNKGNSFSPSRQAEFASFMVSEFERVGVPWSINAMHHFYNFDENKWIDSMVVVLNAISPIKLKTNDAVNEGNVRIDGNKIYFSDYSLKEIIISDTAGNVVYLDHSGELIYELQTDRLKAGIYIITVLRNSKLIFSSKYFSAGKMTN